MTDNRFIYDDDASQPGTVNRWDAPTPYFGSPGYSLSPSPHRTLQQPSDRLGFLPLDEWEEGGEYDQQPPQYVCYTIKWKLTINHKRAGSATEKDLVVAPSDYWEEFLKASLEDMIQAKKKGNQRVRYESTDITVSVNDKTQSDLEQFCSTKNIKWKPVENQLRKWSNLLRIGKKLTVTIVFSYTKDDDDDSYMLTSRRGEKRGRMSKTKTMLAERDAYIAAEEERTGRPSSWNLVYEQMRCRVSACPLKSDWCWENPQDKKHYKLTARYLTRLSDYVDDGGKLEGHDDVPDDIRRDLILESQGGRNLKKANNNMPSTEMPYHPISINVLPAQTAAGGSMVPAPPPSLSSTNNRLVIPGPGAVREYSNWLESRVTEEAYKADIRRACQVTLENLMDLELINEAPDPSFFIEQGVKKGTALRFIRDIHEWSTLKASVPSREC
ncbi:uncharacterized protein ATNIH1004_011654 [Aspergillus tanneri]|uniref:Uncharacterized protein n=1 Tax=Aspergillus tanneri TaxID=1220188 RepID=A0A5M9M438_9EURO|nr:uncharacterized protein ATNIH1004_011654 [Aspergillus tanneri]KAA8641518.1 hypothetical protein ATNIH1004_011654 [Aspergillus tanneri]